MGAANAEASLRETLASVALTAEAEPAELKVPMMAGARTIPAEAAVASLDLSSTAPMSHFGP